MDSFEVGQTTTVEEGHEEPDNEAEAVRLSSPYETQDMVPAFYSFVSGDGDESFRGDSDQWAPAFKKPG